MQPVYVCTRLASAVGPRCNRPTCPACFPTPGEPFRHSLAQYWRSTTPAPQTPTDKANTMHCHPSPTRSYVDAQVQEAIGAAEAAGGGIVFFPPGRYRFGDSVGTADILTVSASNVVLRGAGSDKTTLYLDKYVGTCLCVR